MLKKTLLFSLFLLPAVSHADRFGGIRSGQDVPLSTQTIRNQESLQSGAVFYVSSGSFRGNNPTNFYGTGGSANSELHGIFSGLPRSGGFGPQVQDYFSFFKGVESSGIGSTYHILTTTENISAIPTLPANYAELRLTPKTSSNLGSIYYVIDGSNIFGISGSSIAIGGPLATDTNDFTTVGTSGQVLTSNGPGSNPSWQNSTGGSGGTDIYPATAPASFPFSITASSITSSTQTITKYLDVTQGTATFQSTGLNIQETAGTDLVNIRVNPHSASRTYTIIDGGGDGQFVMSVANQSIAGQKTFTAITVISSETVSSMTVTGPANYVNQTSVIQGSSWTFAGSTIAVSGSNGVLFLDGDGSNFVGMRARQDVPTNWNMVLPSSVPLASQALAVQSINGSTAVLHFSDFVREGVLISTLNSNNGTGQLVRTVGATIPNSLLDTSSITKNGQPTGSPDGTKYLRDDWSWQAVVGSGSGDMILASSQTSTGWKNFTSPLGSTFTYGVVAGSVSVNGTDPGQISLGTGGSSTFITLTNNGGSLVIASTSGASSPSVFNTGLISSQTFQLPFTYSPTVDEIGEMAMDTTGNQLIYYDSLNALVVPSTFTQSMTIESPAVGDYPFFYRAHTDQTVTSAVCISSSATSATIQIDECDSNGINCAAINTAVACTTTNTPMAITNSTLDAGDRIRVKVTAVSGTPGWVAVDLYYRETRR